MEIGKLLLQMRIRLGFSQTGMAKRLNLNPKVLSMYERDKRKPFAEREHALRQELQLMNQELYKELNNDLNNRK